MSSGDTFFPKRPDTKFVVENITTGRRRKNVRIFNYPIPPGKTRDLLAIPYVSEADIRHALLKGELRVKLEAQEVIIIDSNIDLIQFDPVQKAFLEGVGVSNGLDAGGSIASTQHARLRQLIHIADGVGGPMEEFASGAFREILPEAAPFPTSVIWWTSSAKTEKIMEKSIVFDGTNPVEISWEMYDEDGSTIIATVTDTITYSSVFETTRTRTVT